MTLILMEILNQLTSNIETTHQNVGCSVLQKFHGGKSYLPVNANIYW